MKRKRKSASTKVDNPLPRHPRRLFVIHANRVDMDVETEIGDVSISFGFSSAFHAERFWSIALESYAVRGATLIQHGRVKGAKDGKGS
jgi:hypothetical protein